MIRAYNLTIYTRDDDPEGQIPFDKIHQTLCDLSKTEGLEDWDIELDSEYTNYLNEEYGEDND